MRLTVRIALTVALALAATACGDVADGGDTVVDGCNPGDLSLAEPRTLTIATGEPMFPPWVVDDDPTNQEGYESAVAYAIAAELGFAAEDVSWIRLGMDEALAAGARPFDLDIRQHVITEELPGAVVFSVPYYTVRQALVAYPGSPVMGAVNVDELRPLRLGAVAGGDSLRYLDDVVQPNEKPELFETNAAAKTALDAGEIDAVLYGLPAAFFVTDVEIPEAIIAGVLESPSDEPPQFGIMLPERSPLLACVDRAIASLTEDGALAALEQTWLTRDGAIKTITG